MSKTTIKLDIGTIYKKNENGPYYFRYQINGQRKAVSLKTKNKDEAIKNAQQYTPLLAANNVEVISAHVKHAKGMAKRKQSLRLTDAWNKYSKHPERATPATVSEQNSYQATFNEFVNFLSKPQITINDITFEDAGDFAEHLRSQSIAVDTHNRKIRRLKKIFEVLKDYREEPNPFIASSLRRKEREEQANTVKRLAFSQKQEKELIKVLEDNKFKVMNKPELRVVYHIGMFTGQRFKDCVLLRWQNVDLNRKRIWVKQFKTGKEVSIPIAPKLLLVLQEAQEWRTDQYICPNIARRYNKVDANGKNIGNNLVNIDALRVIKWIGLVPSVAIPGRKRKVTVYGFHSLRHSFVSHCAEAGVPKAVVISIIGANSDIVDKHYTHIGEDAQEKAIATIYENFKEPHKANDITLQQKIDKVLSLINSLDVKPKLAIEIVRILQIDKPEEQ